MMEFWLVAVLLLALAVLIAVWPLLRSKVVVSEDLISDETANIASYRDQSADIDWQVEQGLVSFAEAETLKLELQKKLADELGDNQATSPYKRLKNVGIGSVGGPDHSCFGTFPLRQIGCYY